MIIELKVKVEIPDEIFESEIGKSFSSIEEYRTIVTKNIISSIEDDLSEEDEPSIIITITELKDV